MIMVQVDPFPTAQALNALWLEAWGSPAADGYSGILSRSLAHVGAYEGAEIVGFVNVAWDGGKHAFILDTCVHPRLRRQGIASRMVAKAAEVARDRGAQCLHVDFEPHLTSFYRACGFKPTEAGLLNLRA